MVPSLHRRSVLVLELQLYSFGNIPEILYGVQVSSKFMKLWSETVHREVILGAI